MNGRSGFSLAVFVRALFLLLLFLLPAVHCNSAQDDQLKLATQSEPLNFSAQVSGTVQEFDPNVSSFDLIQEERRIRRLNEERQRQLVANTGKLLALVTSLNAEIAHDHPDHLTRLQLRRLAEIEKLAHSVKERMIFTPGGDLFLNGPATRPIIAR
jgi:hypothetical protein